MPRKDVAGTADGIELKRPDDFDKLPRRFKDYIIDLESRLHAHEAMRDAEQPTRVMIRQYAVRDETVRYLPEDRAISFTTNYEIYNGRNGRFDVELQADGDNRLQLQVRAVDGLLAVRPECGNTVRLEIIR